MTIELTWLKKRKAFIKNTKNSNLHVKGGQKRISKNIYLLQRWKINTQEAITGNKNIVKNNA